MRNEASAFALKKRFLFMFILGLIIVPGLTQADDDLSITDAPVPKLYTVPAGEVTAYGAPATVESEVTNVANEDVSAEKTVAIISEPTLYGQTVEYIDPISKKTFSVKSAGEVFAVMQKLGLGINHSTFKEFSKIVPTKYDGRILLDVEDFGKAYIADARNNKLHYLGKPANALKVFRSYLANDELSQSLAGKTWYWLRTVMNNNETISPKKVSAFSITFGNDGKFTGTTDCNNYFGEYTEDSDNLELGKIASTRMFCQDSQELEFTKALAEVQKFLFNEDGQLVMSLKLDSGFMIFE